MEQTFTGQYGIVLQVDGQTAQKVKQLATTIDNNEIQFVGERIPHVTLYHTKVHEVPEGTIQAILSDIQAVLPHVVCFTNVNIAGGKFVFWNLKEDEQLTALHNVALRLATYFDRSGAQQAEKEDISLSKEEEQNVKEYGHPYVQKLWRPHVTIGYSHVVNMMNAYKREHSGEVTEVVFARIVGFGEAELVEL